jgi:dipeptidyl aminopeptidase/acylaminoacyl peptidase
MRALLDHGDFYHAAGSFAGCHDFRAHSMLWSEDYVGWPLDPAVYDANSNVADAHKLQGKLLLGVGLQDDVVDPACTMKVAHALNEADKDYELLIMPGSGHFMSATPYCQRRMQDFFVRNLLHREPRW